eukprot:6015421-Prorocentrum_lima.AAC.1
MRDSCAACCKDYAPCGCTSRSEEGPQCRARPPKRERGVDLQKIGFFGSHGDFFLSLIHI